MRGAMMMLLVAGAAGGWFFMNGSPAGEPAVTGGPFRAKLGDCALPQPSEDSAMIFAGFYEGAGTSTVHLEADNEQQEETSVVDVAISAGLKPVYLVIVGDRSSVMRFSGWTQRIERLIVVTNNAYPTAVSGMPLDRIRFADRKDCLVGARDLYDSPVRGNSEVLAGLVKRPQPPDLTPEQRARLPQYRMPDAIGGAYEAAVVTIGSNTVKTKEYVNGDYATDAAGGMGLRFSPAGVQSVNLGALIATVPAKPYEVLPGWAGLDQLIREGKLESIGSDQFRVLAPIRLPVGLHGAHAVTFIVPPGVARPKGDLGHSKIRSF